MIQFFASKYPKHKSETYSDRFSQAAYDISERAPIAAALRPAKPIDKDNVIAAQAKIWAANGGILDPTTGEKGY